MEWTTVVATCGVFVAATAAYIAWGQHEMARIKIRLDLFDRRYALFEQLWSYLSAEVGDAPDRAKQLVDLQNAQHRFYFLFDQATGDYVKEAIDQGNKMAMQKVIAANPTTTPEAMFMANMEIGLLYSWFATEGLGLGGKLQRYLALHEWTGRPVWLLRLWRTDIVLRIPLH